MIRKGYLALLCAIMLTNCTDQFSAVQQINRFDEIPVGVTEELHLIYSDSARIEAELNAPINIDFTNQKFPYSEFPQGLDATLYGNQGEVTFVRSDYGIYYPKTEIIDLRGKCGDFRYHRNKIKHQSVVLGCWSGVVVHRKKLYFYQCIV